MKRRHRFSHFFGVDLDHLWGLGIYKLLATTTKGNIVMTGIKAIAATTDDESVSYGVELVDSTGAPVEESMVLTVVSDNTSVATASMSASDVIAVIVGVGTATLTTTVTDPNGNPILDANGQPIGPNVVTLTVSPAAATPAELIAIDPVALPKAPSGTSASSTSQGTQSDGPQTPSSENAGPQSGSSTQGSSGTSPAPVVSEVSPASGPAGTAVSITGSGFTGATAVLFGSASVTPNVTSDNALTCIAPPPPPAQAQVTVTVVGAGQASLASNNSMFSYTP